MQDLILGFLDICSESLLYNTGLGVENWRNLWVTSLDEPSALQSQNLSENWTSCRITQSHIPDMYSIDHNLKHLNMDYELRQSLHNIDVHRVRFFKIYTFLSSNNPVRRIQLFSLRFLIKLHIRIMNSQLEGLLYLLLMLNVIPNIVHQIINFTQHKLNF